MSVSSLRKFQGFLELCARCKVTNSVYNSTLSNSTLSVIIIEIYSELLIPAIILGV